MTVQKTKQRQSVMIEFNSSRHLMVGSIISLSGPQPPHPTYPSAGRSQPCLLVRVSLYPPWRPADVHCGGLEYSSYQYGPHQCWISHSGLADCPPAAYSNIVSRIVISEAETRLSSPRAAEYSQRENRGEKERKKLSVALLLRQKRSHFLQMSLLSRRGEPLTAPPGDGSSQT